jgi:hypothetical protein
VITVDEAPWAQNACDFIDELAVIFDTFVKELDFLNLLDVM